MGNCFGRSATVPSVPPPQPHEKAQSTHPTSIPSSDVVPSVASSSRGDGRKPTYVSITNDDDAMTLTLSTKHGAVRRERVQSEHTAASQRLRDGRDYLLPSSGGDVLTSQHSDRLEKLSHQYPSGGMGSTSRNRSVSMGASLHGSRSHSPGHRTRAASGSGQEGRPRFPSSLPSLLPNNFR
jgi:hypothetical protein